MSISGESASEQEICASIQKISPRSSPASSPDSNPTSLRPSNNHALISEGESEINEIKALPAGYLSTLTPDGVLTPPNDSEVCRNGTDVTAGRSNGRLAIFKEGVLCLELSHEDEGDTTKWLKVKSRSVFPNVVRVTKEVTIPCPSVLQPPMFTSPSDYSTCHSSSRVESCTSHSMSDDGSSIVSSESPRLLCRSWRKQSVPQRSVSSCLQFYMKPPSCFVTLKRRIRREIPPKALERNRRRPYVLPDTSYVFNSSNPSGLGEDLCLCTNKDVRILPGLPDLTIPVNNKTSESRKSKKLGLQEMIPKLLSGAEEKLKLRTSSELKSISYILKNHMGSPSKSKSTNHSTTPRKRNSREFETEDSLTRFRPTKKSPSQSLEKTILTVPGIGIICGKKNFAGRQNCLPIDKAHANANYSSATPILPSVSYPYDATDGNSLHVSASPSRAHSNQSQTTIVNGNVSLDKDSNRNQNIKNTSRAKIPSPSLLKTTPTPMEIVCANRKNSGTPSFHMKIVQLFPVQVVDQHQRNPHHLKKY